MGKFANKKVIHLFTLLLILSPLASLSYFVFENDRSNSKFTIDVVASTKTHPDLSDLPDIPYDELNKLWYEPKIEMLIITPKGDQDFYDACIPLMNWKNEKGVKTLILNNYSNYPGDDDPERIRNMIKSYYETENIRWVLLAGDAEDTLVPIRYVYNPDVLRWKGTSEPLGSDYFKPTDYYYADLTGNWDDDGDGNYGESPDDNNDGDDEIDWIPEVYVGRLPAKDVNELKIMINKTLKYETNPNVGDWMDQMLLAGGVSDLIDNQKDPDGEDESRLTEYILQNYVKSEMDYTHLVNYVTYEPSEPYYDLNHTSFEYHFNKGYSTVFFAGHGDCDKYSDKIDSTIYTNTDASSCINYNMTSLVYASACTTCPYDSDGQDDSIGENLIKCDEAGAIGYIGAMRTSWYFIDDYELEELNRGTAKLFWMEFFQNKKFQPGKALYDSKVSYIESDYYTDGSGSLDYDFERKQLLTYCLLGDPEVDVYTDIPKNVTNPFKGTIYEGQLLSFIVQDNNSSPVPYARVHLETTDGKYRTIYGDIYGKVSFRLPAQANEEYKVLITGHNLNSSYFNFTTTADENKPKFDNEKYTPKVVTVSDNICFEIEAHDSQSGIQSVYVLQSNTLEFDDYKFYELLHSFRYEEDMFMNTLKKLEPGDYYFLLFGRDWANNKNVLKEEIIKISIPTPLMNYVLIISSILVVFVSGISCVKYYRGYKKYLGIL
ncbi:MAG: C25 family cysteine peptidase, partial [Candidatus Hermodarchaeota archaeon]